MPSMKKITIDRKTILAYISAQSDANSNGDSVSEHADKVNKQSAEFLDGYTSKRIRVNKKDLDVLQQYFDVLRASDDQGIKKHIEKATIMLHKQKEEKDRAASANNDQNSFAILWQEEKMNQLSSEKLLSIADSLYKVTEYRTDRLKNKLRNYIINRIEKEFAREARNHEGFDDKFSDLVSFGGTYQQKKYFRDYFQNSPFFDNVNIELADDVNLEPSDNAPMDTPTVEKTPNDFQITDTTDEKKKKNASPVSVSLSPKEAFLKKNNFSILGNKKKARSLSAKDYLLIGDLLNKDTTISLKLKKKLEDKLRNFSQSRIDSVIAMKHPYEEGIENLVSRYGTPRQIDTFLHRKDALKNRTITQQANAAANTADITQKARAKQGKNGKKSFELKKPWYKKALKTVAAVVVGAAALFGFAKASNFLKNPSKDKADLKTEQAVKKQALSQTTTQIPATKKTVDYFDAQRQTMKNNTQTQTTTQTFSAEQIVKEQSLQQVTVQDSTNKKTNTNIDEVRKKIEENKAQTNVSSVTETFTNEHDSLWLIRVEQFKEVQKILKINLENLDKVVQEQVRAGNIVLSEKLTEARAKYMISFYAQYPGTEAGQVCKALLNREEVKVSKDDFNKWNDELGDDGSKFRDDLEKKGYTMTTFSALDYIFYHSSTLNH